MITLDQHSPLPLVEIWKQGKLLNPMYDLRQISVSRKLGQPAGTFSLVLKPKGHHNWHAVLDGDEYVIIRGARRKSVRAQSPSTWPICMQGQLATVSDPQQIGSGTPDWSIQATGQDGGGWLLEALVDYHKQMYQVGDPNTPGGIGTFDPTGQTSLATKYHIRPDEAPASDVFDEIVTQIVNLAMLAPRLRFNSKIPFLSTATSVPYYYKGNGQIMQAFTGSVWNLLDYLNAKPFTETFIQDLPSGPQLVYRLSPLTDDAGKVAMRDAVPAQTIHMRQEEVVSTSLAKSTSEALSWYFVYPAYAGFDKVAAPAELITPGSNPIIDQDVEDRLGFKPLDIECPIISLTSGLAAADFLAKKIDAKALCAQLATWLQAVYHKNMSLRAGTIQTVWMPDVNVGMYLVNDDTKRECYIEGFSHTIDLVQGNASTTLTVTRERRVPGT